MPGKICWSNLRYLPVYFYKDSESGLNSKIKTHQGVFCPYHCRTLLVAAGSTPNAFWPLPSLSQLPLGSLPTNYTPHPLFLRVAIIFPWILSLANVAINDITNDTLVQEWFLSTGEILRTLKVSPFRSSAFIGATKEAVLAKTLHQLCQIAAFTTQQGKCVQRPVIEACKKFQYSTIHCILFVS